jgi:hypothetical protein
MWGIIFINAIFHNEICFYQYTNRVAHLYLLHILNNIPSYLVFIFLNSQRSYPNETESMWKEKMGLLQKFLALSWSTGWQSPEPRLEIYPIWKRDFLFPLPA